jgi:hypothetical protein
MWKSSTSPRSERLLGARHFRCDACGRTDDRLLFLRQSALPEVPSLTRARWLCARQAELLPVPYFQVVFILPHELNELAQANPRVIYDLLFEAASRTLLEFGANPR